MDDFHDHPAVEGPWSGGWLVAAGAGLFAGVVARVVGEVGMSPALLVAGVTFLVFGVLLGSGGVELNPPSDHAGDDHGAHH